MHYFPNIYSLANIYMPFIPENICAIICASETYMLYIVLL